MPGLITHYIHGEAVLDCLPKDTARMLRRHREVYNVGTQGPDVFFYYLPALINKKIYGIGTKMHTGNFSLFLKGVAEGVKACPDAERRELWKSYLYGYLTHYALDTATHPYIYYKTGSRKAGEIKTLKYSAYHRSFETALDVRMLKLATGDKPSDRKLWRLIKINKVAGMSLAGLLAKNIHRAYNVPVTSKQIEKAFAYMTRITRLLQSKHGRRKRLMEFAEGITVKDKIISSLIHYGAGEDGIDYLNEGRKKWRLPWDESSVHERSFVDMFSESVTEAAEIIRSCQDYFSGSITVEALLDRAKNLSFSTGLDFSRNVEFRYADIVYA